jgi:hypothetical protein
MSIPSRDEMRRLTLIRHLYNIGVSQSMEAEPRSGLALLPFHDAVEMFLQLASERHGAGATNKAQFMEYWDLLSKKDVILTQKDGMKRLNTARVSLKHSGILCAAVDLEGIRATTTNFFQENTEKVFHIPFHTISLVALISDKEIAQHVADAEKALSAKDYKKTLVHIKTAFILSLRQYETKARAASHQAHDPTLLSSTLHRLSPFHASDLARGLEGDASRAARDIAEAVESMASSFGEAITVIGYGLDFHTYLEFKANTPFAHETISGNIIPEFFQEPTQDTETIQRCINFVVDTAIRLKV